MSERTTLEVHRDGWTGQVQLSVNIVDENGAGHGYRIAGPKFNGSGDSLLVHTLTDEDKAQLRRYLDPEVSR